MVGKKIQSLLDERNLTAFELAKGLDVSHTSIYNWLKKDSIDSKYLKACADFFQIPVGYFFDEEQELNNSVTKDKGEEINSVVENLQSIIEAVERDKEDLRKDKEALQKDKELLQRDKEFLQNMLTNALEFRRSISESSMPGKAKGSVSARLSQAPKEIGKPRAATA